MGRMETQRRSQLCFGANTWGCCPAKLAFTMCLLNGQLLSAQLAGICLSVLGEGHSSAAAIFGSIVIAIEGSEARSFIYLNPGWTVQKYISGQKTI